MGHDFDHEELMAFVHKLQDERKALCDQIMQKSCRLMVQKYNIGMNGRISVKAEQKMMREFNYFKLEQKDGTKIYCVFRIIVTRGKGVLPKNMWLIERKTAKGRVFQAAFDDMEMKDAGLFFTAHLFDRMITRGNDGAANRYQAIKIIMSEFLMNMFSLDENNMLVQLEEENGVTDALFPNRYGICLGAIKNEIMLIKTFVGVNMLRPKQLSIHQAYMTSIDGIHNMAFDRETYNALLNSKTDDGKDSERH